MALTPPHLPTPPRPFGSRESAPLLPDVLPQLVEPICKAPRRIVGTETNKDPTSRDARHHFNEGPTGIRGLALGPGVAGRAISPHLGHVTGGLDTPDDKRGIPDRERNGIVARRPRQGVDRGPGIGGRIVRPKGFASAIQATPKANVTLRPDRERRGPRVARSRKIRLLRPGIGGRVVLPGVELVGGSAAGDVRFIADDERDGIGPCRTR